MNHNKITIINTARFNPLVLVLAIVFIIASIFIFGCSKNNSNKDEYYVKYQANSSTIYLGGKLNVILKGESNQNQTFTIDTRSPWETVIGPVKKGFIANINVSEAGNNFGHLTLQAKISVSKNGSPFALKQSDESNIPRTSVQINYSIDY